MDPATHFDLNRELSRWHLTLGAKEGITAERIHELETHLHEFMREWRAKGLTEEEAFLVAMRRLGDADALAAQFITADPASVWRGRIFWMAIGLLVIPLLQMTSTLIGGVVIYLCAKYDVSLPGGVIALLASLLFVGGMVALFRGMAAGRWPRLSAAFEMFCSRRRKFAWQLLLLAAVPMVVSAIGLLVFWWVRANGFPHPDHDRILQEASQNIRLIFVSQSVLWPVVLAVLAAKYAPVRHPPPSESI